jgi:hypothetical protein
MEERDFNSTITRADFEVMCAPLIARVETVCKQLVARLQAQNITLEDIR